MKYIVDEDWEYIKFNFDFNKVDAWQKNIFIKNDQIRYCLIIIDLNGGLGLYVTLDDKNILNFLTKNFINKNFKKCQLNEALDYIDKLFIKSINLKVFL